MDINELYTKLEQIDEKLAEYFSQRMEMCAEIAKYKTENNLRIRDFRREREALMQITKSVPDELHDYTVQLYSLLSDLSRSYQVHVTGTDTTMGDKINDAIKNTPTLFPTNAAVACQGVEGAYSQIACDKLFKYANIMFFTGFEAVFSAIEKGLCKYGIVPLENSTSGSVNSVYDLMMDHKFSIVRSTRVKVDHNLLAKPGTRLSDVKEIYSHEQAISQCREFLQSLPDVKVIPCENTAVAAKRVSLSENNDSAALASRICADYYGLDCLRQSVQDTDNNYTRFICISKNLEIYPGADRTSLMAVLPHEAGSLYKLLSKLYALGINLNKLESRPLPGRDFEFMFYFDLDTPVYSPQFIQLINELPDVCERFSYLGSYSEIV